MMNKEFRVSAYISAATAGTLQVCLYGIQHPFENVFYRQSTTSGIGTIEAIVYIDAISTVLVACLLLWAPVRQGTYRILTQKKHLQHLPVIMMFSVLSLGLYAYGQSQLDGVLVALIIGVSPFTYILANILLRHGWVEFLVRAPSFLSSKYFIIHVALIMVLVLCYLVFEDKPIERFSWSGCAAVAIVPLMFFMSYNAKAQMAAGNKPFTRTDAGSVDGNLYLSALVVAGLCSFGCFFGSAIAVAGWNGAPFDPFHYSTSSWMLVIVSGVLAGFFAQMLHFYLLREDESYTSEATFYHHSWPAFALIFGALVFYSVGGTQEFYFFYFPAAIIIFIILIIGEKYGWFEFKEKE